MVDHPPCLVEVRWRLRPVLVMRSEPSAPLTGCLADEQLGEPCGPRCRDIPWDVATGTSVRDGWGQKEVRVNGDLRPVGPSSPARGGRVHRGRAGRIGLRYGRPGAERHGGDASPGGRYPARPRDPRRPRPPSGGRLRDPGAASRVAGTRSRLICPGAQSFSRRWVGGWTPMVSS